MDAPLKSCQHTNVFRLPFASRPSQSTRKRALPFTPLRYVRGTTVVAEMEAPLTSCLRKHVICLPLLGVARATAALSHGHESAAEYASLK